MGLAVVSLLLFGKFVTSPKTGAEIHGADGRDDGDDKLRRDAGVVPAITFIRETGGQTKGERGGQTDEEAGLGGEFVGVAIASPFIACDGDTSELVGDGTVLDEDEVAAVMSVERGGEENQQSSEEKAAQPTVRTSLREGLCWRKEHDQKKTSPADRPPGKWRVRID
jgi:hypothetical protein